MSLIRAFTSVIILLALNCATATAGDFAWLSELDIKARNDSSGFQARLATRFHIGDAEIRTVISNVDRPADAYMVLRLRELSRQPTVRVIDQYHAYKNKGWGVMAKNLGIKPGSKAFHALKSGHDLNGSSRHSNTNYGKHEKGNGMGSGKKR